MATLSLVESVDAFVAAIEKSGLLSADEMLKVREAAAKADKAKSVARLLVKDGTLTSWQANQLLYGYHKLIVGKYKLLDQLGAARWAAFIWPSTPKWAAGTASRCFHAGIPPSPTCSSVSSMKRERLRSSIGT